MSILFRLNKNQKRTEKKTHSILFRGINFLRTPFAFCIYRGILLSIYDNVFSSLHGASGVAARGGIVCGYGSFLPELEI